MHLSLHRLGLAFSCFMVLTLSCLAVDDMRTWSDSSGQYTLEAKFIGIDKGKVILEKADGSRIQIELSKLKTEDRVEAMKLNAKKMMDNPFKSEGENPFKDAGKDAAKKTGNKKSDPDPNAPTETNVDWTGVKQLSVFGSEWKAPAITAADLKINWQPRPVVIPSRDFWDKPTGIVAAPAVKLAIVVTALDKPGNKDSATSTVNLCDLEKGTIIKAFPVSGKMTPLAVSPDGAYVVARQDIFGHNKSNMLELWKISNTELARVHRWNAVQGEDIHGTDVQGAAFIEGKNFITWLSGGQLTWWNISDLKPLQTIHLQGNNTPALSPDGKVIAAKCNTDMVLLDARTGDTLSVKPTGHGMHHHYAFSPDGARLACLTLNKVEIYDVASANQTHSISASGFGHDAPCFWTSSSALMAGHPLCYLAPEMNVNVWAYDGAEKLTSMGDYVLMLASHPRSGVTLVPARLPHNSALQLIQQAKSDPNFFVIKPGTSVQIDASGISDPAIKQEAIDALTKKLQDNGNSVGSGGVTLVASMEKSKDHEVAYHTFGIGFGREKTHTVPGWTYQLKIVAQGRTHWTQTGGNHPPHMIHLKQDETIESHLKQYGVPNAGFFTHVELPKYVAKAQQDQQGGSASLRRSQVTSSGIR